MGLADPAKKPHYRKNILNGLSVGKVEGSGSRSLTGSVSSFVTASIYMLMKHGSVAVANDPYGGGTGIGFKVSSSNNQGLLAGVTMIAGAAGTTSPTLMAMGATINGVLGDAWVAQNRGSRVLGDPLNNASTAITLFARTAGASSPMTVGSYIAEFRIYLDNHSLAVQQQVEAFLAHKWGL